MRGIKRETGRRIRGTKKRKEGTTDLKKPSNRLSCFNVFVNTFLVMIVFFFLSAI